MALETYIWHYMQWRWLSFSRVGFLGGDYSCTYTFIEICLTFFLLLSVSCCLIFFSHNISTYILHLQWSLNSSTFCCLIFCSLRDNIISAKGVCALVRVFQVNQSLQKLKLSGWVQPFSSCFNRCTYTETIVYQSCVETPIIIGDTWKHLHE